MSLLRRRMMMQAKDEWDIKLFPDANGQIQAIEVVPPSTAKGFIISILITKAYDGYVYDARNSIGLFTQDSYKANLPLGEQILDRSALYENNNAVGNGKTIAIGAKHGLVEMCYADYLYLKWIY